MFKCLGNFGIIITSEGFSKLITFLLKKSDAGINFKHNNVLDLALFNL